MARAKKIEPVKTTSLLVETYDNDGNRLDLGSPEAARVLASGGLKYNDDETVGFDAKFVKNGRPGCPIELPLGRVVFSAS